MTLIHITAGGGANEMQVYHYFIKLSEARAKTAPPPGFIAPQMPALPVIYGAYSDEGRGYIYLLMQKMACDVRRYVSTEHFANRGEVYALQMVQSFLL